MNAVERAASLIRAYEPVRSSGRAVPTSELIAHALANAGLLAEPNQTGPRDYVGIDGAETWRLRGEFIDALARHRNSGFSTHGGDTFNAADVLVAHLDGSES